MKMQGLGRRSDLWTHIIQTGFKQTLAKIKETLAVNELEEGFERLQMYRNYIVRFKFMCHKFHNVPGTTANSSKYNIKFNDLTTF